MVRPGTIASHLIRFTNIYGETTMSVAKVIEVLAEGPTIEDAAQNAVTEAAKSVKNIKHVYVSDTQGIVKDNRITKYRVNAKVTFVVEK